MTNEQKADIVREILNVLVADMFGENASGDFGPEVIEPCCDILTAALDAAAQRGAQAERERLKPLIIELAADLENEIRARYDGMLDYPHNRAKMDRDMGPIAAALAALRAAPAGEGRE